MRMLDASLHEYRHHVANGPALRVNVGVIEAGYVGSHVGSRRGLNIEDEDMLELHGKGVPRVLYTGKSLLPEPGFTPPPAPMEA